MVFQLVYVSTAVGTPTRGELTALLEQARGRNEQERVTGMLLYAAGRYLQLLEGDQRTVRGVYASILADARHRDVTTLAEGRRLLRQFPTWTMAFRNLADDPITEPGYAALFDDAAERLTGAVAGLVGRLRPAEPAGRPAIHSSRVLGLISG
jgi:hypothetical protein